MAVLIWGVKLRKLLGVKEVIWMLRADFLRRATKIEGLILNRLSRYGKKKTLPKLYNSNFFDFPNFPNFP
jgi:hypothetical protein